MHLAIDSYEQPIATQVPLSLLTHARIAGMAGVRALCTILGIAPTRNHRSHSAAPSALW